MSEIEEGMASTSGVSPHHVTIWHRDPLRLIPPGRCGLGKQQPYTMHPPGPCGLGKRQPYSLRDADVCAPTHNVDGPETN